VLEQLGGLDVLGGPRSHNMYHSAWAWAGDTPFRYTKVVVSEFGRTRTPMVISWPARILPDATPRPQFHHVTDVVPTPYEILGIRPPEVVDGYAQDPIDGTSFAYTFTSSDAAGQKSTQYFEILGSRRVYRDGWMASAFGPRKPWVADMSGLIGWDPAADEWELFDTRTDYALAHDRSADEPGRLQEMEDLFMREAQENKVLSVGGGLYAALYPAEMKRSRNTEWTQDEGMVRTPESQAPNLRSGTLTATSVQPLRPGSPGRGGFGTTACAVAGSAPALALP